MNFIVENQGEDIKVRLIENERTIAQATCYYKNTPKVDNKNIGCIGELEAETIEAGKKKIKKCEDIFIEKNISKKYIKN